jgi:hypothetical protein
MWIQHGMRMRWVLLLTAECCFWQRNDSWVLLMSWVLLLTTEPAPKAFRLSSLPLYH